MFVLHTCDNKRCVRPSHLRLGTHAENMVDMSSRGRAARPDYVGSKHPRAKTNETDVLAIRAAYANGVTKTALASQYGLSFRAIVSIVHREKWTHI
jgi:hypothetical protein